LELKKTGGKASWRQRKVHASGRSGKNRKKGSRELDRACTAIEGVKAARSMYRKSSRENGESVADLQLLSALRNYQRGIGPCGARYGADHPSAQNALVQVVHGQQEPPVYIKKKEGGSLEKSRNAGTAGWFARGCSRGKHCLCAPP